MGEARSARLGTRKIAGVLGAGAGIGRAIADAPGAGVGTDREIAGLGTEIVVLAGTGRAAGGEIARRSARGPRAGAVTVLGTKVRSAGAGRGPIGR